MTKAAVLGSGSWGTAFAAIMADAGTDVSLWCRRFEVAEEIAATRRNSAYLPDLMLPDLVDATNDVQEALAGAEIVVVAIPAQEVRTALAQWLPFIEEGALLVSLMKGIEQDTGLRMSQVIGEVTGVEESRLVVISGPNLAKEIAARQPAAAVVASTSPRARARVAEACAAPYFRPYLGADVIGIEIAGATKNVIGIAVGMAAGMGMGENTVASLLTRGLAETFRLGVALGADSQTFLGLAGVGDLVATCTSPLSRNRSFGFELGRGRSVQDVLATSHSTVEGVKSCRSILQLAREADVDVPIVENIVSVLYEDREPREVLGAFMSRTRKHEI